ncbi:uncharacterized protein LOC100888678 [Strongylocentrotus purpuratus]|uniref:Ig-like domain-containing protein n=1 Tax=Strongylocentrotus purpuratus TaxID=7668 RepID=A0A7M7GGJ9_STRPU|nr:uncharacterized protein LOC100888678 [Strongylocentrotus purpuratus]
MFWCLCLCGYLVLDFSSITYGLRIHSNPNGKEISLAGEDASLTCYYSPQLPSANDFEVMYWKFAPKTNLSAETSIASYRVSTGVRYNMNGLKLNASWQYGGALKIMNTSLDDQGDYTCQIATSMGFRDSMTTLTVYAVPRYLQIYNSSHHLADPSTPFQMTSGEPHSIVCSAFPLSSPATNLSWELDSTLQIARNMIHFAPENITSSRSSSLSSPGDWEFFSTERRLVLTPRDNNHGAVISCYGDHPGLQEKLSVSITLSVLVSPSYIRIFNASYQPLSDTGSVNVTQDRAVTFVCMSTRSRPPTFPRWRIGDDAIEDQVTRTTIPYDDQELYDVSSRMILARVLREHHGKRVTCSASGFNLRAVATNITLHVLGPADPPRITNFTGAFVEGRSRSLECIALNGFPPADIEWRIDGHPTPDTDTTIVKRWRYDVVSRVTILPDRGMNGKEATCIVRTPSVPSTEMRSSVALNVLFCPHRVSISCEPVVAGRPSWITCRSAVSNPAPRLLWAMEGKEIENIHDDHVESSNSINTTVGFFSSSSYSRGFVADDHGKIVRCCAARDEELGCTTDVCMECPLNVYCKPKLLQEGNDMIKSLHENYITLRCSARGNPPPSIEWYSPWMVHDSPINASTPGVISLVDTIIDGEGSDRVTIQSTLVIESSAGIDTRVQGVKCVASNSIGSGSIASFFGNTSDITSVYNQETGLLTVHYSPDSVPPSPDAIPCVHVDYKLANRQAWKLGATCFQLRTNETAVIVESGLNLSEIGLRVCFYQEFCDIPLPPQPFSQKTATAINNILFPTLLVGIALCLILFIAVAFFIKQKRGRRVHKQSNRHGRGYTRSNQVSITRTVQRSQASEEDAIPSDQVPRGEMNHYMDMASSATSQGATKGTEPQNAAMSPFPDPGDLLTYEDMRADGQPVSPGYAHYVAGCQSVDTFVYGNIPTSAMPLKRSDSGICCSYSLSPTKLDSFNLQNTYESTIFNMPEKLQMPTRGAADQGDTDTHMTPEGIYQFTTPEKLQMPTRRAADHGDSDSPMKPGDIYASPLLSSSTVASEWNFVPTCSTWRGGGPESCERSGLQLYANAPHEVD